MTQTKVTSQENSKVPSSQTCRKLKKSTKYIGSNILELHVLTVLFSVHCKKPITIFLEKNYTSLIHVIFCELKLDFKMDSMNFLPALASC